MSTKILCDFMDDYNQLAKRIEEACGNRSHVKAAQWLGINPSTYSAIMASKEPTSINVKMLKALFSKGISSDWVVFGSLPKYVQEKGEHPAMSDIDKIMVIAETLSLADRQELLRRLLAP